MECWSFLAFSLTPDKKERRRRSSPWAGRGEETSEEGGARVWLAQEEFKASTFPNPSYLLESMVNDRLVKDLGKLGQNPNLRFWGKP